MYCLNCMEKVKPIGSSFTCEHCGVEQRVQSPFYKIVNGLVISIVKMVRRKTYDELLYPQNLLNRYRLQMREIQDFFGVEILSYDTHSVHLFKPYTSYKESSVLIDVYVSRTYFPEISIIWRCDIIDKKYGDRKYGYSWTFRDADFVSYKMRERLENTFYKKIRSELKDKGFHLTNIAIGDIPEFERQILLKYGFAKELRNVSDELLNELAKRGWTIEDESIYMITLYEPTIGKLRVSIDTFHPELLEVYFSSNNREKSKFDKFPSDTNIKEILAFLNS